MKSTLGKVVNAHTVHVHVYTHTHTLAYDSPLLRPLTHMKISIIASRKAKAFFSHMQLRVECMV